MLSREEILSAVDIRYEIVEVPEWGGSLRVRSMTLAEQSRASDLMDRTKGKPQVERSKAQLFMVTTCCIDVDGTALFTVADVEVLMGKNPAAFKRIYDAISKASGLTPEAKEEVEKNLQTPAEDSSSS